MKLKLNGCSTYYQTGKLSDGRQALFGPSLVDQCIQVYLFSPSGSYLARLSEDFEGLTGSVNPRCTFLTREQSERYLSIVAEKHGISSDTIMIEPFFDEDIECGVYRVPDHLEEVLSSPEEFSPEELEEAKRDLKEWNGEYAFVLLWGKEYWINENGDADST